MPEISARMQPFWSAAQEGKLVIQRCRSCAATYFPALDICSSCLGDALDWVGASGRAEVYSFVVMHQVYDPAFAAAVPYAVVDVRLEEGPHMVSRIADLQPDQIFIGMPLSVAFEQVTGNVSLPVFRRR